MPINQFFLPYRPAFDNAGISVPGAQVYFTEPATNTPKAIWADEALTVAQTNPLVADGAGHFPVTYLEDDEYRVRIYGRNAEVGVDTPFEEYDPYIPGALIGTLLGNESSVVGTRAQLGAMVGAANTAVYLAEAGRQGLFFWSASNLSANITEDVAQAVYVPPDTDATGASGAWVRHFDSPHNVMWFGATGDGATDDTTAIQNGLTYINAIGGGTLYFPEGTYKVTAYLTLSPNTLVRGASRIASVITTAIAGGGGANAHENLRNGSVFVSLSPINSSTAVHINIEDIGIACTNGANVGAGFYERGGTFVHLHHVRFSGFKYHAVLDQTELAEIELCDFENPTTGCVWLVNSSDLNAGASTEFTNRISIGRCQFNTGVAAYGIIDDGGNAHSFVDNNYNGCLHHIRAAGVTGLKISGGEFESAAEANIRFESTSLAGTGVGSCISVYIGGGAEIVPASGKNCIIAFSLANIVLDSVYFGNTAVVKFNGTANTNAIYAFNCFNAGGGATFDGLATNHFETGSDGTSFKVRTNLPINSVASAAGSAGLNMPHGTAPTSPVDGDVWTTTSGLFARVNGATVGPLISGSAEAFYRPILTSSGYLTAADAAGTYGLGHGDKAAVSGTGTLYPLNIIYLAAADYPAIGALVAKLRLRVQVHCNDVAPGVTFTFGLHPVTRPGTSGGAGLDIYTIGTAVASSTAAIATPAADSSNVAVAAADISLPADGYYVIGVVTSGGSLAASSHAHLNAQLQLRFA